MSDTGSIRSAGSRASTFLNRPHIAPMGPRTRQSTRISTLILSDALKSPAVPTHLLDEPPADSPPPTPRLSKRLSDRKSLPPLSESEEPAAPLSPGGAPAYQEEEDEEEVMPEASSSQRPPSFAPKIVASSTPPPKLTPPEAIKFDTTAVSWKGLPLEAALWTVESKELQSLVSRAIRSSAKESFIRLLTAENLDKVLPAELEKLEGRKLAAQSRYKFLVHRRTMLFHALNSNSSNQNAKADNDGSTVASKLTAQLAETVAECDQQLHELLQINDQMAQINHLLDTHWGSALAIALRKLNTSYARRTSDLNAARDRISQLEAEVEDAWKEAEKMAHELDDYEAAIVADDEDAVIEAAEVITVPRTPSSHSRQLSTPMAVTPTLVTVFPRSHTPVSMTPIPPLSPTSLASPAESHFSFPPQVLLKAKETEAEDVPDTVSIRSGRSTRSAKSYRSGRGTEASHTSMVHAAKKRSNRTSQSSLRINTGHARKQSTGRSKTPVEEQPPVPELPLEFLEGGGSRPGPVTAAFGSFNASIHPTLRRQASMDTVRTSERVPDMYQHRSADDLYLRSQSNTSEEIQLVMRTPPPNLLSFSSMYINGPPPRPPPKDRLQNSSLETTSKTRSLMKRAATAASKGIPSMWMNADSVKPSNSTSTGQLSSLITAGSSSTTSSSPSPVDQVPPLENHSQSSISRSATYNKLRTLTKRYSVSLPIFTPKNSRPLNIDTSRRSS